MYATAKHKNKSKDLLEFQFIQKLHLSLYYESFLKKKNFSLKHEKNVNMNTRYKNFKMFLPKKIVFTWILIVWSVEFNLDFKKITFVLIIFLFRWCTLKCKLHQTTNGQTTFISNRVQTFKWYNLRTWQNVCYLAKFIWNSIWIIFR